MKAISLSLCPCLSPPVVTVEALLHVIPIKPLRELLKVMSSSGWPWVFWHTDQFAISMELTEQLFIGELAPGKQLKNVWVNEYGLLEGTAVV